ncbi:MAG: DUF547 domain-containing protein [Pseudomonadota bacterium]
MTSTIRTALLAATAFSLGSVAIAPAAFAGATTILQAEESINAPYNDLLAKYLSEKDGIHLFDYGAVTDEDRAKLGAYVEALQTLKPSQMSRNDAIAYWANLYNAKTLEIIIDNYPVDSIRDIGGNFIQKGPWREKVVTVEGKEMSLDNIEHDTVRANFDEPRIHYAFNCASIGCPNLMARAWEGATLDEDLDAGGRAYISHPRGIRVEGNRVIASSIYKWFSEDFGDNDAEVLDHIRQYATGDKLAALEGKTRINKYEYDWSLNDK